MPKRSVGAGRARGRLIGAALVAVLVIVSGGAVSLARPSKQDLAAAKARLDSMNRQLDQLVEQYDQAKIKLASVERELSDARDAAARSKAEAVAARDLLDRRAAVAYENTGSELEAILGATSLADFSDRIEFVTRLSQQNADAAARAEITRQQAIRAQRRLNDALAQQQSLLVSIRSQTSQIHSAISQQEALVKQIEVELARPLYPKPKPRPAPQITNSGPEPQPSPKGGGGPGPSPSPTPQPPDPGSGAQIAVQAAFSVIGTPYTWGGSNPQEGFDCSGLTMWSWEQAGVSLPHSSAAQYGVLPHVAYDQLQPGDLVFFYQPISHVGIYVGGGMMIHSPHTGGFVEEVSLAGYPDYVGAGRPG